MWERGEYKSYEEGELKKVLKAIKKQTPRWCRIDRLIRDISKKWVSTGTMQTNLRQILLEELKKDGVVCKCIRCREVRSGVYDAEVKLLVDERESLGGKELFLSFEADNKLFSMLRLRLPDKDEKILFKELEGAAIIREVHTYGQVRELSSLRGGTPTRQSRGWIPDQVRNDGWSEIATAQSTEIRNDEEGEKSQHRGLGKRLMAKAEEIAAERGYKKMAVISAIGTREYYTKLGYELEGEYVVKGI